MGDFKHKETFSDILSPAEADRIIRIEKVTRIDVSAPNRQGEISCVVSSTSVHLISPKTREVEASVLFSKLCDVTIKPYQRDDFTGSSLRKGVKLPDLITLKLASRRSSKGSIIQFVAHLEGSRLGYLIQQAHKMHFTRRALRDICMPMKSDPSNEKDAGEIAHPVRRLLDSGYSTLYDELFAELVTTKDVEVTARILEKMTILSGISQRFSETAFGTIDVCMSIISELEPFLSPLLRDEAVSRWRKHKETLEEKRKIHILTFKVKLKLNRQKQDGIEFFREEAGLRVFYVGPDPGQNDIQPEDIIVKVAKHKLKGIGDEEQKRIWEKSKFNGAVLTVERKNDEKTMKEAIEKANMDNEMTTFHVAALRCVSSCFALLSRITQSATISGNNETRKRFRDSVEAAHAAGLQGFLQSMLLLSVEDGVGVGLKSTKGLSALQDLKQRFKASRKGDMMMFGPQSPKARGPRLNVPAKEMLFAGTSQYKTLEQGEDMDAFEILIERTAHLQVEAFGSMLELLADPEVEALTQNAMTKVVEAANGLEEHTQRVCRMVLHASNLAKAAQFTNRTGYYIYQYAVVMNAFLADTVFARKVVKLSGVTIRMLSRGFSRIRRSRRSISEENLRYYALALPLLEALMSKLAI